MSLSGSEVFWRTQYRTLTQLISYERYTFVGIKCIKWVNLKWLSSSIFREEFHNKYFHNSKILYGQKIDKFWSRWIRQSRWTSKRGNLRSEASDDPLTRELQEEHPTVECNYYRLSIERVAADVARCNRSDRLYLNDGGRENFRQIVTTAITGMENMRQKSRIPIAALFPSNSTDALTSLRQPPTKNWIGTRR